MAAAGVCPFRSISLYCLPFPRIQQLLVVTIYDTDLKRNLSREDVRKKVVAKQINQNEGDPTEAKDLAYWSELARIMNRKAATGSARYLLRLGVASGAKAHELGGRQESRKHCDGCHEGDVGYLDKVFGP